MSRPNGSSRTRPSVVAPGAGDLAVHEERPLGLRVPGVEDPRAVLARRGSRCGRACTSRLASQVGRNRTGAGVSAAGSGARGRSSSSRPCSSRKRRSSMPLECLARARRLASRPSWRCPSAARARRRRGSGGRGARRASISESSGSGPTHSSASPNRSARRRSQVPAGARERGRAQRPIPGSQRPALRRSPSAPRPLGEKAAQSFGRAPQPAFVGALHAPRPSPPLFADRDRERPVVAPRDDVDRAAHQRRLHERPPLERAGHGLALEAVDPRPEADVGRRRVLRLDAAHPLDGARGSGSGRRSSSSWRASIARFSSR